MKTKSALLATAILFCAVFSTQASAGIIKFGLAGESPTNPADVFEGFITFDTAVAPDEGFNELTGIVDFELTFTGSLTTSFDFDDLTGAYWAPISDELLNLSTSVGAGRPWISIAADNGTVRLLSVNYLHQITNFFDRYDNLPVTYISNVPEPGSLAIFGMICLVGMVRRRPS